MQAARTSGLAGSEAKQVDIWIAKLQRAPAAAAAAAADAAATDAAAARETPADGRTAVRHEWYQTGDAVTVTVFARALVAADLEYEIEPRQVALRRVDGGRSGSGSVLFTLGPLVQAVDPARSSVEFGANKITIVLAKHDPGLKWPALEGTPAGTSSEGTPSGQKSSQPPRLSSRDWEKLADDMDQDENEKDRGVDELFKSIYRDADDDTRRAMMKSYVESNGTALSTNWKEVSKGPVPTRPPDGMKAKKWED